MTALQLNAEIYRGMAEIADDETYLAKVAKYITKLVSKKKGDDPTLMTKEEFFRRVDEAKEQYLRGEYTTQLPGESVTDMLKRCGYDI